MTIAEILQICQIGVSLFILGGGAFAMGGLFQKVNGLTESHARMRAALFPPGGEGVFVTRSEADLMQQNANREHEAFDRRLTEQAHLIGLLQARE